ncbi:hypothetical protein ACJJTC_018417 [Scirpophaga incertulas]
MKNAYARDAAERYQIGSICYVSTAKKPYDLECAQVPEQRFYNTMLKEHKKKLAMSRLLLREISDIITKVSTGETKPYEESNNNKNIVLYLLSELYKENEQELHYRLVEIFRDILHVDLTNYIEESRRLGKFNNRYTRPQVIELLSKRMQKYILEKRVLLPRHGLSVSELLDKKGRENRKLMREEMPKARGNGLHAVI